jgi:hypothetical protein
MIMTGARAFLFAVVVCGGMLVACDGSPEQTEAPSSATKKTAPKVAGLAPDMVAAVSAGKTATMLGVHFALRAVPTVNQALPVDIAIVPHRDFTSLRAHFESREGLALTTGEVLEPLGDSPAEKAVTHQLTLLPAKEGVFMVTAIVETEGADGTVTRIFSIPVIVAPPAVTNATAPTGPAAAVPGTGAPAGK